VHRLEGRPFVLIGVNSDADRDELKRVMQKEAITWRSFWDGGSPKGPIATRWNVSGWPTVYVLDGRRTIRFKNVSGEELDRAVDSLLGELNPNGSR
jgi:hypothetical protein